MREVAGDAERDIFDGLAIHRGLLTKEQYVPSENVAAIYMGEAHLTLTRAEVETLEQFTEPAAEEQIVPGKSTWYQRLAWWTTGRNR